ncbi:hypothetical protein ESA94_10085 [Lacibacter luteus]|uniref:T9SS type A sorting domain-containing protein n=1 Tax=Lacibacter luteus TaxID=2508719 RepID=A0A4Q1CJL3_9BACT|nr:hypothetical protein [Lacibacter luteus]RXK60800.1 hypothetical protein ESA94_10085 [Lacibacter luteus]
MNNNFFSAVSIKQLLLLAAIVSLQLPLAAAAQVKTNDRMQVSKPEELKIKQEGNSLVLRFPKLQFKSALKIINSNGILLKAIMVDEGLELYQLSSADFPKGIYSCVIENRTQRFTARVLLR